MFQRQTRVTKGPNDVHSAGSKHKLNAEVGQKICTRHRELPADGIQQGNGSIRSASENRTSNKSSHRLGCCDLYDLHYCIYSVITRPHPLFVVVVYFRDAQLMKLTNIEFTESSSQ